jgi:hypothetical protein
MSYRIAGIDVHKKMLAVVVADVEVEGEGEGEYQFKRCRFSSSPEHLRLLAEWLIEQQVEEAVMESTAQYWQPVCARWRAATVANRDAQEGPVDTLPGAFAEPIGGAAGRGAY